MPGFFVLLSCGLYRISQFLIDKFHADWPASLGRINWKSAVFPALIAISIVSFNAVSFNSVFNLDSVTQALLLEPPLHSGSGGENDGEVRQAMLIREITTPEAKIALVRAGTIPYFSDRFSLDELGKTDTHIAHEPMKPVPQLSRFIQFLPGHMKYDYDYSIGQLKPDMIVQLWQPVEGVPAKVDAVDKYYRGARLQGKCVYLRQDSENIVWAKIPAETCR
jgi:hypothetical protein